MIVDALMEANEVFKFHENLHNPAKYVHYTDNVLSLIECSPDPSLVGAQKLLKRIKVRDIYRHVGQL